MYLDSKLSTFHLLFSLNYFLLHYYNHVLYIVYIWGIQKWTIKVVQECQCYK
jgi:hypothetical protein